MSARKRPAAAALAAPPKKRLRGKQEAPSYNASLPDKFLAWRAQHIYTAYKNLGGEQLMESLADDLALTEPNPAHYAERMGVYIDGRLAAEGQPPVACLNTLVEEWGVELTVAEWRQRQQAGARKKSAARKVPAGRRGETNFCRGLEGSRCRFSTKEAGQPSRGAGQKCFLCSKAF